MNKNWPAILLLLAAATSLSGCYDYRSGKHWNVENASDWQQISHVEWVNKACDSPARISTQRGWDGYAHSLFLIPLGLGGSANNPKVTGFYVSGEGLNGRCNSSVLVVSVNGRVQRDTQVSACSQPNDCCSIEVPVSRGDMESVHVAINNPGATCTYAPLVLESSRHVCLRETRFGGSEGCKY